MRHSLNKLHQTEKHHNVLLCIKILLIISACFYKMVLVSKLFFPAFNISTRFQFSAKKQNPQEKAKNPNSHLPS